MEGVTEYTCVYKIDALQCTLEHGHDGDHIADNGGRQITWGYYESDRDRDLERGYPECLESIVDKATDEIHYCHLVIDHEGNHVSGKGFTFSDEDIEAWLGGDDPTEVLPEPTPVSPVPSSPTVIAAIHERQPQDPSLIAVTRLGGSVDRHQIIGWHVHEGALYVITYTDDIVYAAGQWVGVRAEARS